MSKKKTERTNGHTHDAAFGDAFVPPANDDWYYKLIKLPNGFPTPGLSTNVHIPLAEAPEWTGKIRYDTFRHVITCEAGTPVFHDYIPLWGDRHDAELALWMERHNIRAGKEILCSMLACVANKNAYHSGQAALDRLSWDGTPRLERVPQVLMGATDSDYISQAWTSWMIALVARMYQPGCKVDQMLIFEGVQGIGKSTFLRILAGSEDWFLDSLPDFTSRDSLSLLRGRWIVEVGELTAFLKTSPEAAKCFISRQVDQYRLPYDRKISEVPRTCGFAGTTNRSDYLRDITGNRRFLPIAAPGPILLDELAKWRDQIVAEAVHRYKAGEEWWRVSPAFSSASEKEQLKRMEEDLWEGKVQAYLRMHPGWVTTPDIAQALELPSHAQNQGALMRIAAVLRKNGYVPDTEEIFGKQVRGYRPKE